MILVDTSIWIDHLDRGGNRALLALLEGGSVVLHPFVLGEIAMGGMKDRRGKLALLSDLPRVFPASEAEVAVLIKAIPLHGTGLSYIDAHLLAAARAAPANRPVRLWTTDGKLHAQAKRLNVAYAP